MSQNNGSRDAKRARFAGQEKKNSGGASPLVLIVGLVVVLALIGGGLLVLSRSGAAKAQAPAGTISTAPKSAESVSQGISFQAATQGHDPYTLVQAEDGAVRLALSTFDDNRAHYYTFLVDGHPVEFFVLKSKDGVVRAAFNACDVCFPAQKGYRQEGDEMVCNNCGQRFPADQINVVSGGCNPSPLARTVVGDTLVILTGDLAAGLSYF